MPRAQASVVSCVEALQHVDRFISAHFTNYDPVRPHPEGGSDQITNRYFPVSLRIWPSRLQANQVADALNLQLSVIFDRDDTLILRNKVRERI